MTCLQRQVESLKTQNMNYILDNLGKYIIWDYDTIKIFPPNIKHYMLRRFVSSMHYWKNIDFKNVLKALITPCLECIDLTLTAVDDDILEILTNCSSLRRVYLTKEKEDYSVTSQGLIIFISSLKHLNLIQISNCDAVNDDVVRCIAENCPHLTGLDTSGCINVTDQGIETLANLKDIQWLSLSWTGVTSKGVYKLATGSSGVNLKELRLASCHMDRTIARTLTKNCHALKVLVFSNSHDSEDEQSMYSFLEDASFENLKQLTWTVRW